MKAGPTGHPSSMIAKPENPSIRRDLYMEKLKYIFPYKSIFFFSRLQLLQIIGLPLVGFVPALFLPFFFL